MGSPEEFLSIWKVVPGSSSISNQFVSDLIAVYEFGMYLKTIGKLRQQEED